MGLSDYLRELLVPDNRVWIARAVNDSTYPHWRLYVPRVEWDQLRGEQPVVRRVNMIEITDPVGELAGLCTKAGIKLRGVGREGRGEWLRNLLTEALGMEVQNVWL